MNQHSGQELVDLNAAIQAMVSAFNERTQELAEKEQQALALMSNKLKISLEAASIAHEIKQPLSVVRLTSQSLNQLLNRFNNPARLSTKSSPLFSHVLWILVLSGHLLNRFRGFAVE